MERCLQLAKLGAGNVAPNPMVGAVLVYEGRIIGEGYHQVYGQAHAEVNCINSVAEEDKALIGKSILYVSLEPCAHYGKTPPCANLIVEKKIPKVVIACKDPFAEVDGKGIAILQQHGVEVETGVMEEEALALNKSFFTFLRYKRPYIILKWAQSGNGKISDDHLERTLISNAASNRLVHKWRSETAAIMVGTTTAEKDDPSLTTRLWPGKNPVRIVMDMGLRLPATLQLFDKQTPTIVFNTVKEEYSATLSYYRIEKDKPLQQAMELLYKLQLQSVLVEGGAALLQSFIREGLWDEARVITNTSMHITAGTDAPVLQDDLLQSRQQLLTDNIAYYIHGR